MAGKAAVTGGIDLCAGMLNAHADRKRFLLHRLPAALQHRKGVPRAVPYGEHRSGAGQGVNAVRPLYHQSGEPAAAQLQIGEHVAEAHLTAEPQDFPAQIFDGFPQPVGADVRRCLPEDVRRCTAGGELFEHLPAARVPDAGVQLAVRKGAGAALAELDVGPGIQTAGPVKGLHFFSAGVHVVAALEQNRMQSGLRERQRSEQPGRTAADDHRRIFRLHGRTGEYERFGRIQAHLRTAAVPDGGLLIAG